MKRRVNMNRKKKLLEIIGDNAYLPVVAYFFMCLLIVVFCVPNGDVDEIPQAASKVLCELIISFGLLFFLIFHVMRKMDRMKEKIEELQDHIERLEGLNEAAEQDPPKMEEHL